MATKENTLHFSIGEDFGSLLTDIAHEKGTMDYDLNGALKILQDSLIGMPVVNSLKVLVGIQDLIVNVEAQELSLIDSLEKYKRVDINMITRLSYKIDRECKKLNYWLKDTLRKTDWINVKFPTEVITEYILDGLDDGVLEIVDEHYMELRDVLYAARNFVTRSTQKIEYYIQLRNMLELYGIDIPDPLKHANLEIGHDMQELHRTLLLSGTKEGMAEIEEAYEEDARQLMNYMEASKVLDERFKDDKIEKQSVEDDYTAGWIAPNGDYYAMNGEIANLLHNQLADLLLEKGVIDMSEEDRGNPDSWLMRNGWVRLHGNWVLFEGYMNHRISKEDIQITDVQRKVIYEICGRHHGGMVKLGLEMKRMSATRFKSLDQPMLRMKIFNL